MEPGAISALVLSGAALLVSILSASFAVLSWREAHRPIVIARVTTAKSGNVVTALRLLIENTGNRPARDVTLACEKTDLDAALDPGVRSQPPDDVKYAFDDGTVIPVLENGRSITCAFGMFSAQEQSTWAHGARLPISISYTGLQGRKFEQPMVLLLADDHSFTGLQWSDPLPSGESG